MLAQRLKRGAQHRPRRFEFAKRTDRHSAPLSFTQHQLWVIEQMMPGNPAYNLPYGFRLRGPLDLRALEDCFNKIIERHEMLRTTFGIRNGEPRQLVHAELRIEIEVISLNQPEGEDRERGLQELASRESLKPFDLSRLPLIRVTLFALGEAEHVLLINLHHIVADGLSVGVLLKELDEFYSSFSEGRDPHLPDLTIQYGDYAEWQRDAFASDATHARAIDYWRQQLGGGLPMLELPGDHPRPALQSFKGGNVFFQLSAALTRNLKAVGDRADCTFFTTVLAAFQVLLHRYAGADEVVIGTPVATRSRRELDPLIGLILNMTALRCDLSGDPTFVELLRRSRNTALDAFSNSELPFERVIEHLKIERDPGRNPVFQVVLQVLPAFSPRLGSLEVSGFRFDLKFAQFDLALHLYEEAGGYQGRFEYCSELFDAGTIERLCGHFLALLDGIVCDPQQRISRLPLLTESERHQSLVEWNRTEVDYPRDACIHELFEDWARRAPEACALEMDGHGLTYRELDAQANQVARFLARHGIGVEDKVAVCLERGFPAVVAILGILKAGGAYVPLDPDYPESRLKFMLGDTAAPILLTQQSLRDRFESEPAALKLFCVDTDWPRISREETAPLDVAVGARNLAYVIFTSGSTGQPKGVCVEHRGVVRLVKSPGYVELGPQEILLQFAPLSFDASTFELWGSLLNGAKLVICPPGMPSTHELGRLIRDRGVTTLWLTAALFHQMVDDQLESLKGVRQLLAGGDVLSVDHARRLLAVIGSHHLINGYGPTENTTFTCCHRMSGDSRVGRSVPIGRPIGNTRVYVLDRHGQPVPGGVPGELYAGGDGLAREYLNQPELTARKFVSDPLGCEPSGRLYRTGDRVRYLPDGTLEFLGRFDNQIKLRGHRIEPGEIETCLVRHAAVREAVVIARADGTDDKKLVAYVVTANHSSTLRAELQALLAANLPGYMVPSALVLMDSLPLTPNGKVDRSRLPAPDRTTPVSATPRNPTERLLAEIWSEVLGPGRIGIEDNFFVLGGNSLLAMRVLSRVRAGLEVELPLRTVFEHQTLTRLAAAIDQLADRSAMPPAAASSRHRFISST